MAKKLKKDTSIAKVKSLKTNVTRKFDTGGTGDPLKKSQIATAADSSYVASGANAPHNFYLNHGYKILTEPVVSIREREVDMPSRLEHLFESLARERDFIKKTQNLPGGTKYKDYTNYTPGKHRFEQRELTTGEINLNAPRSKYDDRITPQGIVTYSGTGNTTDVAEVPKYDKLAVTPWGELSDKQKIKRLQQYGGSGTPYKDKASIKKAIQELKIPKPTESPMEMPKMKEASLLPLPKIDLQPQLQNTASPYNVENKGYYYIHPSGNPGIGVIRYQKNNGDGTYENRVIGPSLIKDWYNNEDQRIFEDKDSSTNVGNRVDYDPRDPDQKIYASMHDAYVDLQKNDPSVQIKADKLANKFARARGVRKASFKFATGGPANLDLQNLIDPEKPLATTVGGPGKDQFFPKYYETNKTAFDAADAQARGMGIDWYSKRAEVPQYANASNVFLKTFKEAAPTYYFPEENYDNVSTIPANSEGVAFTNTASLEPGKLQSRADQIMYNDPYATPKSEKKGDKVINEAGEEANLNENSIYYRGMSGAKPYVAYEELTHIGSGIANHIPETNHAEGMQILKNTVTPKSIRKMGYQGIDENGKVTKITRRDAKYLADNEEYLTSLNNARASLNLDPTKNYTEDEALKILEQGRAMGAAGGFNKENAQEEQMSRFYAAIGWPSGGSKFLKPGQDPSTLTGKDLEEYNQAKREAARRFLITHNAVAENESNTEDLYAPKMARYGGYQKYEEGGPEGGPSKKKKPVNQTYPPNYFVTDPTIVYHTDPREFEIASRAEADSSFAHNNTQNFINYLKVNPQARDSRTAELIGKPVSPEMMKDYTKKGVTGNPEKGKRNYPKNSATGEDIKPVNVGIVWPSKTRGEVYVQGHWNKDSFGPNYNVNLRENTEPISLGYYTAYYPAPKQHHVLQEPIEPIGIKPVQSNSAPVTVERQLPEKNYTLHQTGNGGGAAYLHETIRDKDGRIIKSQNLGVVLTKDFLTPEQEKEFSSPQGGSASVEFNPKAKIFSDIQEPLQIIEQERGTKQKQTDLQKKATEKVEAEKEMQQTYEEMLREKQKAKIKKAQEEIEKQRAFGGFKDPEKRTRELSTKTKTSDENYVIKQDLYDEGDYNSIETKTRRSLKGFVKGAPKPETPFTKKISSSYSQGGMSKNMLNANSTTGPRSNQSWQDPGVNEFSGNTNGVKAAYYLQKGGLKSKVSSKFAKLKM